MHQKSFSSSKMSPGAGDTGCTKAVKFYQHYNLNNYQKTKIQVGINIRPTSVTMHIKENDMVGSFGWPFSFYFFLQG